MPTMDPEAVITSFYQPHIVLGEMALWGCIGGQPKPGLSLVSELLLKPDQEVDREQSWILVKGLDPDYSPNEKEYS